MNTNTRDLLKSQSDTIYHQLKEQPIPVHSIEYEDMMIHEASFFIENLLPEGWTYQKSRSGYRSLEALLEYMFKFEWAGRGFVSTKPTKYPYDVEKISWFMKYVLNFYMTSDGQFYQRSRHCMTGVEMMYPRNHVSRNIMAYFNHLSNVGKNHDIPIFIKLFDTRYWTSKEVKNNPKFFKPICFPNSQYSHFFQPIQSLNYYPIHNLMPTSSGEYRVQTSNMQVTTFDFNEKMRGEIHALIQEAFDGDCFISNKAIVDVMKPHHKNIKMTNQALVSKFVRIAKEFKVEAVSHQRRNARGKIVSPILVEKV